MGRRGPPPLPTATKVLRGTFRKDRVAPDEPQPRLETPECPEHVTGEARAEWERIVPELEAAGLLTIVDRAALAAYCQLWARWIKAAADVDALTEWTVTGAKGALQTHPAVVNERQALAEMKRYLSEFGLTPSSRTRISATPVAEKPSNPFGDIA